MTIARRRLEWSLIVAAILVGTWLVWRGLQGATEGPGSKLDPATSTTLEFDDNGRTDNGHNPIP